MAVPIGDEGSVMKTTERTDDAHEEEQSKKEEALGKDLAVATDEVLKVDFDIEEGPVETVRARWTSKYTFWLASIGAAVGLGNIWRFPFLVYKSGGGAFLVPYFIALFLIGIPLMYLEMSIGQWAQQGPINAYKKFNKLWIGLGWTAAISSFMIAAYYAVIMAWCEHYVVMSFKSPMPWKQNSTQYFEEDVLGLPDSRDVNDAHTLMGFLVLGLLVTWIVVYVCIWKGVKSSGYAVLITVPLPYLLLLILFFRAVTLDGAVDGIKFYLEPDMKRVFSSGELWADAVGQIFFSTSLGSGITLAYASFNDRKQNTLVDTCIISFANSFTSVFAGFVVFATLGFKAKLENTDVASVVKEGPGLAFIAFPEVLDQMPASNFFSVLFFVMLLTLGIDSSFAMAEAVNTSLLDMTDSPFYKKMITIGVCVTGFMVGILFATDGGLYFFEVIDYFISHYLLVACGFFELVLVGWVYGAQRFLDEINEMTGVRRSKGWAYAWKYLIPIILFAVFIMGFVSDIREGPQTAPWLNNFGWFFSFGLLLITPIGMLLSHPKSGAVGAVFMNIQIICKLLVIFFDITVIELLRPSISHNSFVDFVFAVCIMQMAANIFFIAVRIFDAVKLTEIRRKIRLVETIISCFLILNTILGGIMFSTQLDQAHLDGTVGRYLYSCILFWYSLFPACLELYLLRGRNLNELMV